LCTPEANRRIPAPAEETVVTTPKFPALLGPSVGSGLPHRVLPSKFVFGKIKIDLNKLFYRNILSITDNKGKQNEWISK
jgi:hypothetical protein